MEVTVKYSVTGVLWIWGLLETNFPHFVKLVILTLVYKLTIKEGSYWFVTIKEGNYQNYVLLLEAWFCIEQIYFHWIPKFV